MLQDASCVFSTSAFSLPENVFICKTVRHLEFPSVFTWLFGHFNSRRLCVFPYFIRICFKKEAKSPLSTLFCKNSPVAHYLSVKSISVYTASSTMHYSLISTIPHRGVKAFLSVIRFFRHLSDSFSPFLLLCVCVKEDTSRSVVTGASDQNGTFDMKTFPQGHVLRVHVPRVQLLVVWIGN